MNFVGDIVPVTKFIIPNQATDESLLVTMSEFAVGVCPQCLYDISTFWWSDQKAMREVGKNLAEFRKASQRYTLERPEKFEAMPEWNTKGKDGLGYGWESLFQNTPTISTDAENYGIIHGDLHQGNMMLDPTNGYQMELLDLDNA